MLIPIILALLLARPSLAICITECEAITIDQIYCDSGTGTQIDECMCKVYEKDIPPCVACYVAAGFARDTLPYSSLLASCPGGAAYYSTDFPAATSSAANAAATTAPVQSVASTTAGSQGQATVTVTQGSATATETAKSGAGRVKGGSRAGLVVGAALAVVWGVTV